MSRIQTLIVRGDQAYEELGRLRALYPRTGRYPVCLGHPKEAAFYLDGLPSAEDVAFLIANSLNIDPMRWFTQIVTEEPTHYQAKEGEWPTAFSEADELGTAQEYLSRDPDKELLIGLFAVSAPWEVLAHLGWGGFNDCPGPAEHCAVHRYWGSLYQTEIAVITRDLIRCLVGRPPATREASLKLAWEQFAYSPDIVTQGCSSIAALAAGILDAPDWYFWWD